MEFTDWELIKKQMAKRKMEAQNGSSGGGGGGGEVRRIHIIYFLSRRGRIEQPHLIKLHHLSRNGVHLRDVKRWLSELRGKDMPELFAWSYKRRYKTGYLWQDLMDDDLITPISDNEYVLKGSEIPSIHFEIHPHGENKASMQKDEIQENPKSPMDVLKKPSCEIEEESPPFGSETSTMTDDSMKHEEEKNLDKNNPETPKKCDKFEHPPSFYSTLLNKNGDKKKKNKRDDVFNPSTPASSTSSSSFTKSKSYSSSMLNNLITCGAVDTNDAAMVMINRRDKKSYYNVPINKPDHGNHDDISNGGNTAQICKGDKLGGSERVLRTTWNQQQQKSHPNARKSCDGVKSSSNNKHEFNNQKPVSAAYKPVNGPTCSQCGKMFKPERMHKHMKSCRGMKSLTKSASTASASAFDPRRSSMDSSCQESVSGYFLTNSS